MHGRIRAASDIPLNKLERYVIRVADWRGGDQKMLVQERQRLDKETGEWRFVYGFNISLRHFQAMRGAVVELGELLEKTDCGDGLK